VNGFLLVAVVLTKIVKSSQSKNCQKYLEQERGISPSLPDTLTFGMNSPQMAQIRASKNQNDPES